MILCGQTNFIEKICLGYENFHQKQPFTLKSTLSKLGR